MIQIFPSYYYRIITFHVNTLYHPLLCCPCNSINGTFLYHIREDVNGTDTSSLPSNRDFVLISRYCFTHTYDILYNY